MLMVGIRPSWAEQKKGVGQCSISLATFDDMSYDKVIEWSDISMVPSTFELRPSEG